MRLGFIGGWGHHYLRAAITDPACGIESPVAVAGDGHDNAAARRFADSLPTATTWFDNPQKMLSEFAPSAVSVGSIYACNSDWAAAVLERDIPVVSDKPIAASWQQLKRLKELTAGRPQRVIATEFDFRCRADFCAAQAAVAKGAIGEPVLAVAQKSYRFNTRPAWYGERSQYGGTLLWVASHGIDVIPFVTGRRYAAVTGVQGNLSRPNLEQFEDHVVATYRLDNGGSAVVHADFLRPAAAATHGDDRLRLAGTEGVLEVRQGRCHLTTTSEGECDVTAWGNPPRPLHAELLAALAGDSSRFSTVQSLEMAEILLRSRDALDGRSWLDIR